MNDGGKLDESRFMDYAAMIGLFNQYSDPELLTNGAYTDQVSNFSSGKYAFITQGSWIGATMTGDNSSEYASAGNFKVGMIPYAFQEGMDTILTSAPSWWAVSKEGNVEGAKAFLQWCSESTAQKILVEEAGFVRTSNPEVFNLEEYTITAPANYEEIADRIRGDEGEDEKQESYDGKYIWTRELKTKVYSLPNSSSKVISTFRKGTKVQRISYSGEWS